MSAFKLEYLSGQNWEVFAYAGSIMELMIQIRRAQKQNLEIRCLNKLGEDLTKGL